MRRRTPLLPLSPREQLRAGRLPRRLAQLMLGLVLYGASMAMMLRAGLGLDPWDVFHYGVATRLPWSFGTIVIVVGALVLLLWLPLRQWPGLGTVANVVVIGLATDATLAILSPPEPLPARLGLLVGGIVLNALAGGLYIGSQLGPGPRDGLMTGLARRTGWSVRLVRTGIELTVLAAGWALGGVVGVGTVLYALLIGPLVQFFLPRLTVALLMPDDAAMQDDAAVPDDAAMQDDAAMPDDAAMQDDAAAYPPATRPRERPGAPPRGGSATISAHAARS